MASKIKSVTYNGQTYTKDSIKEKLSSDDRWLHRAILAIYAGQTSQEQNSGETVEDNGIGFSGADSYVMSIYAKMIMNGQRLYAGQLAKARKTMPKYAGQLLGIISEKSHS